MPELTITAEEYESLMAMMQSLDVLGRMFQTGEESAPALRMSIATIRSAADMLETVAQRWESDDE